MEVSRVGPDRYRISQGNLSVELSQSRYEDLYYAIPLDAGTLFRLMNDTVLDKLEARETFNKMIEQGGGLEPALRALQENVQRVSPEGGS